MSKRETALGLIAFVLLASSPALHAVPRFSPATECTREDRGSYPWNYQEIVSQHIRDTYYDPQSVIDLEIVKPAPGWWTTAAFKMTRNNTKCYWYIAFAANAKNRMGGYVGRKFHGLWVREGVVIHSAERSGIDPSVRAEGEHAFLEELEELSEADRASVLSSVEQEHEMEEILPSYLQELRELAKLRDEGIISEEEFQKKKKQILGVSEASGGESLPQR